MAQDYHSWKKVNKWRKLCGHLSIQSEAILVTEQGDPSGTDGSHWHYEAEVRVQETNQLSAEHRSLREEKVSQQTFQNSPHHSSCIFGWIPMYTCIVCKSMKLDKEQEAISGTIPKAHMGLSDVQILTG